MRNLLLIFTLLLCSYTLSAQLTGGAGLVTGTGDPNSITLLDLQDTRGESVLYFRTDANAYYGYNASLASGSRWYLLALTDDQTASEVTVIQQNGVTGANVQADLEALWAAIAAGGDAWGAQVVQSDITLTGDGTGASVLKVDTTVIATISYVESLNLISGTNVNVTGDFPDITISVPSLDDADPDPDNEKETLSTTGTSDPTLNLTTVGGTTGDQGAIQFVGGNGMNVENSSGDILINNSESSGIYATSHTDAGNQGVIINGWFQAANPNEMGIPAGTKIQRAY